MNKRICYVMLCYALRLERRPTRIIFNGSFFSYTRYDFAASLHKKINNIKVSADDILSIENAENLVVGAQPAIQLGSLQSPTLAGREGDR